MHKEHGQAEKKTGQALFLFNPSIVPKGCFSSLIRANLPSFNLPVLLVVHISLVVLITAIMIITSVTQPAVALHYKKFPSFFASSSLTAPESRWPFRWCKIYISHLDPHCLQNHSSGIQRIIETIEDAKRHFFL